MYTQQVKATHASENPWTQSTKFLFTLWRPWFHIDLVKPKGTESKAVRKIEDNRASAEKIPEDLRETEAGADPRDALKSWAPLLMAAWLLLTS